MPKAKITSKGQVTLPKRLRDDLGLRPGDEIEFYLDGATYRVRKLISENPFTPWIGYAKHLKGWRTDDLISAMRGEPLDHSD